MVKVYICYVCHHTHILHNHIQLTLPCSGGIYCLPLAFSSVLPFTVLFSIHLWSCFVLLCVYCTFNWLIMNRDCQNYCHGNTEMVCTLVTHYLKKDSVVLWNRKEFMNTKLNWSFKESQTNVDSFHFFNYLLVCYVFLCVYSALMIVIMLSKLDVSSDLSNQQNQLFFKLTS